MVEHSKLTKEIRVRPAFIYTKAYAYNSVAIVCDHEKFFTSYYLGPLNFLCAVSRKDAQNFLSCRQIKNGPLYVPYLIVSGMLWSHDLVMSQLFSTYWIQMLYTHIFNQYCTGTTTESYHSWDRNIVPNSPESFEALTR